MGRRLVGWLLLCVFALHFLGRSSFVLVTLSRPCGCNSFRSHAAHCIIQWHETEVLIVRHGMQFEKLLSTSVLRRYFTILRVGPAYVENTLDGLPCKWWGGGCMALELLSQNTR